MDYLIIGAGAAGISAVEEIIKHRRENDQITVITDEPYPFYYRPRLIECLSGGVEIDEIIIHDRQWFKKNGINLKIEEKALEIITEDKKVITGKSDHGYDKLLIANGAYPFVPPIEGGNRENVFALRNAADAAAIRQAATNARKAVVVGGGLLGLESAYNLGRSGLEVTVVETRPRLLPRQLDEKAAELLKKILENKGLNFYLNAGIECFLGKETVKGVKFGDGTVSEAELVLVSAGIRPDISLAESITGMKVNKGIIVNEFMETSLDCIYAAGDIAEYKGSVYGIWGPSRRQGKVAGLNMKDIKTEFAPPVPSYKLKVAGVNVVSAGELDFDLNHEYAEESGADKYRKTVYDSRNNPIGLIEVGDFEDTDKVVSAIT